jgi:cytidylate kinase
MPVITIRGQTGSGAREIGHQVARLIEGDYVDRQVIAEVAELLKRPEAQVEAKEQIPPQLLQRIMEPLRKALNRSGNIDSAYLRTWEEPLDDAKYLDALESVVQGLALEGNIVLVGRGSQFILHNNQSVLHVLVVAPLAERLNRVMAQLKTDEDEARQHIDESDTTRRAFIKRFFQGELEEPEHYDLVINTKYINYDAAARLIVAAAAEKNPWRHG